MYFKILVLCDRQAYCLSQVSLPACGCLIVLVPFANMAFPLSLSGPGIRVQNVLSVNGVAYF